MGPKFVVVFSGVDVESVTTFITDIKNEAENIEISLPIPASSPQKIMKTIIGILALPSMNIPIINIEKIIGNDKTVLFVWEFNNFGDTAC